MVLAIWASAMMKKRRKTVIIRTGKTLPRMASDHVFYSQSHFS